MLLLILLLFAAEESLGLHALHTQIWLFSFLPVLLGILWVKAAQVSLLAVFWLTLSAAEGWRTPAILDTPYLLRIGALCVAVGLCIWISRQRQIIQAQQERLRHKALRLEAQLATTRRATALAHEIRQPLTIIQIESRQLLNKLNQGGIASDGSAAASAELLHRTAAELNRTIGAMANLLRSARSEQVEMDFSAVVLSTIEGLQLQLEQAGVALRLEGLDEPQPLIGDPEQLRIACLNLIRNSINALRDAAPDQRRLAVTLEPQSEHLCLHVEDSGPGLPAPLAELIPLGSHASTGMGQGLFIAERIALNHAGSLQGGRSSALGGAELRLSVPRRC